MTNRARFVEIPGYPGCIELTNDTTRVVVEPNVGGRVLCYEHDGREALYQDAAQSVVTWAGGRSRLHPAGGRFDIGPEYGGMSRDELWLGAWQAEITDRGTARLTSKVLETGLQLVREFELAPNGSALRCTQRMHNRGTRELRTFHWGRAFLPTGGIVFAPLRPHGRFPRGYSLGGAPGTVDFLPTEEPAVRIRDGILEILGEPRRAKFNFDVMPGWLAYLSRAGLLFVQQFPVESDRPYGEIAANNASIWYGARANTPTWPGEVFPVELEPIGPWETIAPGGVATFTETWSVQQMPFPDDSRVDLDQLRALVARRPVARSEQSSPE